MLSFLLYFEYKIYIVTYIYCIVHYITLKTKEMSALESETKENGKENEKEKEDVWKNLIKQTKTALEKIESTKAVLIQKLCVDLEENGMPIHMICGRVTRELADFASRGYIIRSIDDKYKDEAKVRDYMKKVPEQSDIHTSSNVQKNVTVTKTKTKHVQEEEEDEIYQIKVEDYRIQDVENYDKEFLKRLVIYLDERIVELESALEAVATKKKK